MTFDFDELDLLTELCESRESLNSLIPKLLEKHLQYVMERVKSEINDIDVFLSKNNTKDSFKKRIAISCNAYRWAAFSIEVKKREAVLKENIEREEKKESPDLSSISKYKLELNLLEDNFNLPDPVGFDDKKRGLKEFYSRPS